MATIDEIIVKLNNLKNIDYTPAFEESCLIVENAAKENCPVDTGQLRNSIRHEATNKNGVIGTNVDYAPYVEFGTGLFAENGDGRKDVPWRYQDAEGKWHTTSGMKPQPYLRPALEDNKQAIQKVFSNLISKELKK